mmetsp:Transcript_9873/g.10953  ORF Transcript_9873/g.10953 Transcript_9873/m.10953 type:complete len:677 (-) Transcript_9873:104-2134(-)
MASFASALLDAVTPSSFKIDQGNPPDDGVQQQSRKRAEGDAQMSPRRSSSFVNPSGVNSVKEHKKHARRPHSGSLPPSVKNSSGNHRRGNHEHKHASGARHKKSGKELSDGKEKSGYSKQKKPKKELTPEEKEKEQRLREARRLLRLEQVKREEVRMAELFRQLEEAFVKADEDGAVAIKKELDILRQKQHKREERRKQMEQRKKKKPVKKKNGKKKGAAPRPKPTTVDTEESISKKLEAAEQVHFDVLHPPRAKKCCLVLDIDYTLFDHRWQQALKSEYKRERHMIIEFKRPYLHEFLTTCHEFYDLIIWSATSMVAIQSKITNLKILDSKTYHIQFVLSKEHMFYINKRRNPKTIVGETVKPLDVIWSKFPEFYGKHNTIHIDDLGSNFQLNPNNGLQIQPFKEALKNRNDDKELFYLTKYLLMIAKDEPDFSALNHYHWKEYVIDKLWQKSGEEYGSIPQKPSSEVPLTPMLSMMRPTMIKAIQQKEKRNEKPHAYIKPPPIEVIGAPADPVQGGAAVPTEATEDVNGEDKNVATPPATEDTEIIAGGEDASTPAPEEAQKSNPFLDYDRMDTKVVTGDITLNLSPDHQDIDLGLDLNLNASPTEDVTDVSDGDAMVETIFKEHTPVEDIVLTPRSDGNYATSTDEDDASVLPIEPTTSTEKPLIDFGLETPQ